MEIQFGPGEEKLAQAFEQLYDLWRHLFVVKARADIDSYALAALMDCCVDPAHARDVFQKICAVELADNVLQTASGRRSAEATAATQERVAHWNEVLNKIAAADRPHPE